MHANIRELIHDVILKSESLAVIESAQTKSHEESYIEIFVMNIAVSLVKKWCN